MTSTDRPAGPGPGADGAAFGSGLSGYHGNGHVEPETVTAGQVRLARFRVVRDERWGRQTPDLIRRIAAVRIPGDAAHA